MSNYPEIPLNTQGRRPIDPTRTPLQVGTGFDDAVNDGSRVYVKGANHTTACELVKDFNRGRYPDICAWMKANQSKVTGDGISLWMGMVHFIRNSVNNAQPVAAVNPTFQNNANPNGGKTVPKAYQGGHLDPNLTDGRVIKRHCAQSVQMWKMIVRNHNSGGGAKTLLWTDREQLADDLVQLIGTRDFQAIWDFMEWVKYNVPLVGFGQVGTHLMDSFDTFMDILEHEMNNAKGRKVSASLFKAPPLSAPDDDDLASGENYALDVSKPDTWGIGNKPHAKVKEWEPDTPDPDVDLMKSIRDVCSR